MRFYGQHATLTDYRTSSGEPSESIFESKTNILEGTKYITRTKYRYTTEYIREETIYLY